MKITLDGNNQVRIEEPATKVGEGTVRTMTLQQFQRHAVDPNFTKGAAPDELAAVQAAITAAAAVVP